jgi:cyanophycinase
MPNIAIIPTAAAKENPSLAAKNGVNYFRKLGGIAHPVYVLNRKDSSNPDLVSQIESSDILYLTGGNPKHLVDTLKESRFLEAFLDKFEQGAIVAGSSAGAMAMGLVMEYGETTEALGIIGPILSIPHHEKKDPERVHQQSLKNIAKGMSVIGIDSGTAVISDGATLTVHGKGEVVLYKNEGWETFRSGNTLII